MGPCADGLSLTDQAIAFGAGNLQESVVRQMLGAVDRQHVQRILSAVAQSRGADLVAAVNTLREMGLSAQGTLDELAAALQHMALIQTVPGLSDDDADAMVWQELAHQLAADETQLFYSLALQGRAELALAPDEYAGLLMILLRWLAFKPGGHVAEPPQEPGRPKAPGPTPPEAVAGQAQRQVPPVWRERRRPMWPPRPPTHRLPGLPVLWFMPPLPWSPHRLARPRHPHGRRCRSLTWALSRLLGTMSPRHRPPKWKWRRCPNLIVSRLEKSSRPAKCPSSPAPSWATAGTMWSNNWSNGA